MPRDWRSIVDGFSDVQKLVHLSKRWNEFDVDQWRVELLQQMRQTYESELASQAARVGCPGRSAILGNGPILTELNEQAREWAEGIINTYNFDLAAQILSIGTETPTANRHVYAKRLEAWDEKRAGWKNPQIAQYTEGWTRAKAQQDFYNFNSGIEGRAMIEPTTAACPICAGWVARSEKENGIELSVILQNPPPYHPGCVHSLNVHPSPRFGGDSEACGLLWMGA